MNPNLKVIIVIFLTLLCVKFFGAIPINNKYLFLIVVPFIAYGFFNNNMFGKFIFAMIFGLLCSVLSSYYFRDQSIVDSIFELVPYTLICFYFLLIKINLTVRTCEKIIVIFSVVFCLCYIFQYIMYPVEFFHGATYGLNYEEDIRIRMYAQGFSSLGYFFGLNKLIIKKNPVYLLLMLLCFLIIILMGFRTMSIMIVVISFVLIIRLTGLNKKLLIYTGLIIVSFYFLSLTPVFSAIIDRMNERNETQNFSNNDYIRVKEWEYYTGKHFKNSIEYFFGSGLPSFEKGKYGPYMASLFKEGLVYADFGLLGLSWMIGVIPVLAMLLYSTKVIRTRVDKNYYYVGYWYMYLLSISLTTFEFARFGNFVVQALGLYIIEKTSLTSNCK